MDKGFSPAEWPLSPCFHPHSRGAIVSLGACWAFSVQPVLPSVWRPVVSLKWNVGQAINAVTGTRLWAFVFSLPGTSLILFLPFGFTRLRPRSFGCCCAMVRHSNVESAKQWWIDTFGCKVVRVPQQWDNPLPSDVALKLPGDDEPTILLSAKSEVQQARFDRPN
jgi:hypothetical protein